jgi:type IV pilus assembly protein PilC
MGVTDLLQAPWAWLLIIVGGFLLHRRLQALVAQPKGAALVYRVFQRIPLVGSILQHGTIARYCSAAGPLVASGMNLPKALRLAAGASGNPLIIQDAEVLVKTIMDGATPTEHMAAHPQIYSPTLCHMLVAGEEASNSGDMYDRAGHFHQLEMESSVDLLGAALEPILLICVSIAVALLILAIFLPLYGSLSQFG